jgi:hypothetical protein
MSIYKDKYLKYKTKYLLLKIQTKKQNKKQNKIQTEIIGGTNNNNKETLLMIANRLNQPDKVKELLDKGANVYDIKYDVTSSEIQKIIDDYGDTGMAQPKN